VLADNGKRKRNVKRAKTGGTKNEFAEKCSCKAKSETAKFNLAN